MSTSVSRSIFAASLIALVVCLGSVSLHAQCTYYVSPNGNDSLTPSSTRGTDLSTAFATLQAAHDYILNNSNYSNLGYRPINVCVEGGTYYASDYTQALQTDYANNPADAETAPTSLSVLNISLPALSPSAEVTFEPDPATNPYVLIVQTGWYGVNIAPSAIYNGYDVVGVNVPSYVTVKGFNVQGQGYFINANSTLQSFALGRTAVGQAYLPFFDGACISVTGRYPGTGDSNHPGVGIPNHITILNNVVSACGGGGVGAAQSDYIDLNGNSVIDNAWWGINGASGISLGDSVDIDNVTTTKSYVRNNWVTGNNENVPWTGAANGPHITDGEGIIIDTNLNSDGTQNPTFANGTNIPPYGGRTQVANNVVWGNGSSAIEVFESQHVDVEGNSTYGNVWQQYPPASFQGRGELSVSYANDVVVANNVFESVKPTYAGITTTSFPLSATYVYNVANQGYVWFENNVYYAGSGQTAAFPTANGPNAPYQPPNSLAGFYEGGSELWNVDPGYVNVNPTGWPLRIDLGVTGTEAGANGCTSGGAVCDAPATDILGQTRNHPGPTYPSGAYANINE